MTKPRVMISSDIGGHDKDDDQSLVHALLYGDKLRLEGLISSPPGRGRASDIHEVIDVYARDYAVLKTHSDDYPSPDALRGLVHLAGATEVISDAALEISEGVLRGMGTHPVVAAAVEESDEVIVRLAVQSGSQLDGATLASEMVKTETGMRVIAVRRGPNGSTERGTGDWVVAPGPDTRLGAGDVLIAKGTDEGADRLERLAGEQPPE